MNFRSLVRERLQATARRAGYDFVPAANLFDWQRSDFRSVTTEPLKVLQPSDMQYLQAGNPRLIELRKKYADYGEPVNEPVVWTGTVTGSIDLSSFRGDNAYIWQRRGADEIRYGLTTYYLLNNDPLGLLDRLVEDGAYGCQTFDIDGRIVSRDLLDSVRELSFLAKYTRIAGNAPPSILDIGAGYGRLAHRCTTAFPRIPGYYCADAVPESSFLCEFYLGARGLVNRAQMVMLTRTEQLTAPNLDLAINVHSFSECSVAAIKWWVRLLADKRVHQLFVVPNRVSADKRRMLTGYDADMSSIVESFGYVLRQYEPKYASPLLQKYGLYPAYYFLYELPGG